MNKAKLRNRIVICIIRFAKQITIDNMTDLRNKSAIGKDNMTDLRNKSAIGKGMCGIISGILLGIAIFLMKISVNAGILNIAFFINPMTWITAILAVSGFVLMQKAFHSCNVSTAITTIAGLSIVIPTTLAYMFLAESMNPIGIALILFGVLIIGLSKKTLNSLHIK